MRRGGTAGGGEANLFSQIDAGHPLVTRLAQMIENDEFAEAKPVEKASPNVDSPSVKPQALALLAKARQALSEQRLEEANGLRVVELTHKELTKQAAEAVDKE